MDKVSYIKQLSNDAAHLGSDDFIRALILALEPEESAELLQQSLVGDSTLRRSALRKVCADIETGKVANSSEILAGLKHKVLHGEPRYRNGYAYCLLEVSRVCDSDARIGTQSFLGSSKYVGLRRRSYKLYDPASPQSQTLLNAAWDEYHDKEAAWLIVKHFPPEFLAQNRAKLANVLSEGWQLSKLYLRLVEVEATAVEELFTVDSVSYGNPP